jgi:hypothetical protein
VLGSLWLGPLLPDLPAPARRRGGFVLLARRRAGRGELMPDPDNLPDFANLVGQGVAWWSREAQEQLSLAVAQVEAACGQKFDPETFQALTADQQQVLGEAVARQAVNTSELDDELGQPIQGLPEGFSVAAPERQRLAPSVTELLAGTGLILRSGTVAPDPTPARPPIPWWWWV